MLDTKYLYIIFFLVIIVITLLDYKRRCYKNIEGFESRYKYICDPSLDRTYITGESTELLNKMCKDQVQSENIAYPLLKNSQLADGKTLATSSTSDLKYLSNNTNYMKLFKDKPKVASANVEFKNLMKDECINACSTDNNCNFALVGKPNNPGDNQSFNRLGQCGLYKQGSVELSAIDGYEVFNKKNSIEYSIEFFLKINNLVNGWRNLIHIGNSDRERFPGIWIGPNSTYLHFAVRTSDNDYQETINTQSLPLKVWNHIVFTVQGNTVTYYLNGKFFSSSKLKGFPEFPTSATNVYVIDPWNLGNATGFEIGKVNWYPLLVPEEFVNIIFNDKSNLSTDWRCMQGTPVPIRLNGNGDVECSSTNYTEFSKDSAVISKMPECNSIIANMPIPIKPYTCSSSNYSNPAHWCATGKRYLDDIENGACKAYGLDKKNLSNECLLSIWKNQGCTNEDMIKGYSEDGWWKKQTRQVVENDMLAWATLSSEGHRTACYGPDKRNWPESQKFTKLKNMDRAGFDIEQCIPNVSEEVCKTKCLNNPNCKSSNYVHPNGVWGKSGGCCYKTVSENPTPIVGVDFYQRRDVPQQWSEVPGALKQVNNNGNIICGVNSQNNIYCKTDGQNGWGKLPGGLTHISVDGIKACGIGYQNIVYCADNVNSPNWVPIQGTGKQIDMDNGKMVIISLDNSQLYVADYKKSNWKLITPPNNSSKQFINVSIFNTTIVAIDTNYEMFYADDFNNPNWRKLTGKWKYANIDNGNICGMNMSDEVFCGNTSGNWNQKPGKMTSISMSGPVSYATGTDDKIYRMVNLYNSNSENKNLCETKYTNWDAAGGKRTNFLDRQNITCGDYKYLNQFQLEYDPKSDQARYKYKCCPIDPNKYTSSLTQKTTQKDDSGRWDARYINRHNLNCNDSMGMNQMLFQSFYDTANGSMRYLYNCVNVNNKTNNQKVPTTTRNLTTEIVSEGPDIDKLAPLNVSCNDDEAISNLQLKRTAFNNQFFYEYKCSKLNA